MEAESRQPVTTIMDSWVGQTGYPVLQVDVRREADEVAVHVSQRRFLYTGENQDTTLWQVPLGVSSQGASQVETHLLSEREGVVTLHSAPAGTDGWVKVNARQTGFYRVQYAQEELSRLVRAVESQELPAVDRLGLQEDAYALGRAGLVPATQFLDLARAYKNEGEYAVWADFGTNLRQLDALLSKEACHPQFQAFARELLQPIAHQVSWEPKQGEGHLQTLLRSTVLSLLGAFGDTETLKEARQRFERFLEEPASLVPDLRGVVYGLAAQEGDATTHDALRRLAQEATLQEEKVRRLMALARFSGEAAP